MGWAGTIATILQARKLSYKENKGFGQDHTASDNFGIVQNVH